MHLVINSAVLGDMSGDLLRHNSNIVNLSACQLIGVIEGHHLQALQSYIKQAVMIHIAGSSNIVQLAT